MDHGPWTSSFLTLRPVCVCATQRVLEAEENGDGLHDDEDFEQDTPKRKSRNRGKVSVTVSSTKHPFGFVSAASDKGTLS